MYNCAQPTVTDAAFVAIASGCPALHILVMSRCDQDTITDVALVSLAAHQALEKLYMYRCTQDTITDAAFDAIAGGLPALRHLDISWAGKRIASQAAVEALSKRRPEVEIVSSEILYDD